MAPRHHLISPDAIYAPDTGYGSDTGYAPGLDDAQNAGFDAAQAGEYGQDAALGGGQFAPPSLDAAGGQPFPAPPLAGGFDTIPEPQAHSEPYAPSPHSESGAFDDAQAAFGANDPDVTINSPFADNRAGLGIEPFGESGAPAPDGFNDPHGNSHSALHDGQDSLANEFYQTSEGAALAQAPDLSAPQDHEFADPEPAAHTVAKPAGRGGSFFMYAGAFIASLALGAATYFFVGPGADASGPAASAGAPPVLRADPRPAKVLPKDPGGRQFANQNRAVQNRGASKTPAVKRVRTVRVNPQGAVRVPSNVAKRVAQAPAAGRTTAPEIVFRDGGVSIADALNAASTGSTPSKTAIGEILEPAKQAASKELAKVAAAAGVATGSGASGTQSPADIAAALTGGASGQSRLPKLPSSVAEAEAQAQAIARARAQAKAREQALKVARERAAQAQVRAQAQAQSQARARAQAATGTSSWDTAVETSAAPAATSRSAALNSPRPTAVSQGVSSLETGNFVVQLSSRKDRASAEASFRNVQRRFPQLLGDKAASIKEADLGAKGTWYRVRIAPASSRRQANELCNSLKAAGLSGCLVRSFGS
ncbi:MAG: SPOR domain-containing protein [Pseudomonadota bacterium]